ATEQSRVVAVEKKDNSAEVPLELGAIYEAHRRRIAGWVARLCGPGLDAEDLLHEVFLTIGERLPSFRGDAKLTTWLYQLTANVVLDRRRRERRMRRRNALGGALSHGARQPTPLEQLERVRASEIVYRVLDELDDKYRTLLILFEIEGHSGQEIAE